MILNSSSFYQNLNDNSKLESWKDYHATKVIYVVINTQIQVYKHCVLPYFITDYYRYLYNWSFALRNLSFTLMCTFLLSIYHLDFLTFFTKYIFTIYATKSPSINTTSIVHSIRDITQVVKQFWQHALI